MDVIPQSQVKTDNRKPLCPKCNHPAKYLYERFSYRNQEKERTWKKRGVWCERCQYAFLLSLV